MYNLFLGHLCISRGFSLIDQSPQRVILVPKLIDFLDHLITSWLNELFRIGFDHLHFSADRFVLLLDFFEVAKGSINVIFVIVALWNEGDVWMVCSKVEIHNGLIMKVEYIWREI